jgi:hypothetical protein
MKRFLQVLFAVSLCVLISVPGTTVVAFAEGGATPQIALSVLQASPGATIEITGGRFEPDIFVTLILSQNGTETRLGKILADDHGEFTTTVLLPSELQLGQYEFRAVDEKNRAATSPLAIVADASGSDAADARQEEDGLLLPMPTLAPNAPTPMLGSVSSAQSRPSENPWMPSAWIAAGIGMIFIMGLLIRLKR